MAVGYLQFDFWMMGEPFYGGADYPFHQTGLSLGRCYTFGMIAAKHAMGAL